MGVDQYGNYNEVDVSRRCATERERPFSSFVIHPRLTFYFMYSARRRRND